MTPKKMEEVIEAHVALKNAEQEQGQARRSMESYLINTKLSRTAQDKILNIVELDFADQVAKALAVCEAL